VALTDVNLFRIDGTVGSISSADIDVIKNSASISNNIVLNSDGTTTLTPSNIIKSGTAQASTSGTAIDFTGLPSWVKRITVMFSGVSTNGTGSYLFRLGTSGGITTSGYAGASSQLGPSAVQSVNFTSGFGLNLGNAANLANGSVVFINITGNSWAANGSFGLSNSALTVNTVGSVSLSGTLTQVRITNDASDTFDAGTINILYEG
jgi:hypothetical protein